MDSLYTKYRPTDWNMVIGQESVVKILRQQIDTNHIFNCMIFAGTSGTGKTTLARIFANKLNKGQGSPIEVDAASNNGVENVRQIVATASERSLNSEYKVIIIDEAHMLSNQAWNAFLKCIEEPPHYTVFIFCTTDPHKIPPTIQNRCMRFNFTRVSQFLIEEKLQYIYACEIDTLRDDDLEAPAVLNYISRICNGEVRKAISLLETCIRYDINLNMENALAALGNSSFEDYFKLVDSIIDSNSGFVAALISEQYNQGIDIRKFVDQFTDFVFDILKYIYTKNIKVTKIPDSYQEHLDFSIGFKDNVKYFCYIIDKLLDLKVLLKNESSDITVVQIVFNQISRFA